MPHITVVGHDSAGLHMLEAVSTETGYRVSRTMLQPTAVHTLQSMLPDLVLVEVGGGEAAIGWNVLAELRSDLLLRHVPVVVYVVEGQTRHRHAAQLAVYGGEALVLPCMIEDIRAVVEAASESRVARCIRSRP